jgi:hypothetical protein
MLALRGATHAFRRYDEFPREDSFHDHRTVQCTQEAAEGGTYVIADAM